MSAGCNGTDSDEYVYSIKGYDPCHEIDFSKQHNLEYNLTCKDVDDDGKVIIGGHPEGLGYEYSNLMSISNSSLQKLKPFNYTVVNKYTNMSLLENADIDFVFDVRDFKYMSHIERYTKKITDPEIAAGLKTDTIEIDWQRMLDKDEAKESKYVVAGRIFWEANLFKPNLTSYTASGFFAQKGYVEPKMEF